MSKELNNPFDSKILQFDDDFICTDNIPRYMHVDLGLKHDAMGVSMTHVSGWKKVLVREDVNIETEQELPIIKFDFIGKIKPEGGGEELYIADVRELIINELSRRGFKIRLATFDRFASHESLQILIAEGYAIDRLSLDRTTAYVIVDYKKPSRTRRVSTGGNYMAAWQSLKNALTDKRVIFPYNEDFVEEAKHAEKRIKGSKVTIDCQSSSLSLDLLESMAGSIFNATNNESDVLLLEEDIVTERDKRYASFYKTFEREQADDFDTSFVGADYDDNIFYSEGGDMF